MSAWICQDFHIQSYKSKTEDSFYFWEPDIGSIILPAFSWIKYTNVQYSDQFSDIFRYVRSYINN